MLDPARSQNLLPLKPFIYIMAFLFLFILIPAALTVAIGGQSLGPLVLFTSINPILGFILFKVYSNKKYRLQYDAQDLQEKFNILKDQDSKEAQYRQALLGKINRYSTLKNISEDFNRTFDLDSVAESLVSTAFSTIARHKGVCILSLIDKQLNLQIYKTKKEDSHLVIRAKEGDIFDRWVLRHLSPLLVEDISQDFRFDLEKYKAQEERPIASLICAPLISEHRFMGVLRLDSPRTRFFSQEDLRFLAGICDLGAVALENSELFQRAQELAIRDTLTGLYTKAYFSQRLKEECLRSTRQNTAFSLLMLDIDFFKDYNDRFGHTAGDIVLKKLSLIMAEPLRGISPVLGRFGGEEFCALLTRVDKKEACTYAQALRQRVQEEKFILRRSETSITVSIGLATFPSDAADADELLRKADKAMYEAKQKGRNQVCCI